MYEPIVNENKEKKPLILASLSQRVLAFVIDLIIIIISSLLIFLGVNKGFANIGSVKESQTTYLSYYVDSGLYYDKGDGTLSIYSCDTYLGYQKIIYSYYHEYLGEKCPTPKPDYYDIYWYNVFIYGQDDELNRFTQEEMNNRSSFVASTAPTLFEYAKEGDTKLYNAFAVPKSDAEAINLLQYYRNDASDSSAYMLAVTSLTSQDFFLKEYVYWYRFTAIYPLAISFGVGMLLFWYLVTFIFKNNKTIGKKLIKISVSNQNAECLPWYRFLFRFLFMLILVEVTFILLSVWRSSYLMGLAGLLVLLIVSFVTANLNKNQKSLHDLVVNSYVTEDPEKKKILKK